MENNRKVYPPLTLVKRNPKVAAVISKLVTPRIKESTGTLTSRVENSVDHSQMSDMTQSISQRILDNSNIVQLFPDIELASQILISSILSPKDMVRNELIFKSDKKDIPAELAMALTTIIKEELDKTYKLSDKLPLILKEMLFISGAYVEAVIPENVIDQLINNPDRLANESITEISQWTKNVGTLGFLGELSEKSTNRKFGLESVDLILKKTYDGKVHIKTNTSWEHASTYVSKIAIADRSPENYISKEAFENVEISDDFRLLTLPKAIESIRKKKISDIIYGTSAHAIDLEKTKTSMEDVSSNGTDALSNRDFTALLYKGVKTKTRTFISVPTDSQTVRKSVSKPLVIRFPTEAVIPVYTPGDVSNHIGYFVMIDGDGHPVTKASLQSQINGQITPLGDQSASMSSLLLKRAQSNLIEMTNNDVTMTRHSEIYANIVEADLLERLKKGIYGENVGIARNNDVYRIMLSRSLANQYTRLLYVPRETMTYFMFDHYDNGIGKSLLDDLRVMLSLRAIILFSKEMIQILERL